MWDTISITYRVMIKFIQPTRTPTSSPTPQQTAATSRPSKRQSERQSADGGFNFESLVSALEKNMTENQTNQELEQIMMPADGVENTGTVKHEVIALYMVSP